jgi:hypothetical protein
MSSQQEDAMTHLTLTAPISIRRPRLAVAQFAKRWVGMPLASAATAVGNAFAMAYAAPYQPGKPAQPARDADGRDPSW